MQKILVIGASGQVASSLVNHAPNKFQSISAVGRPDIDILDMADVTRVMSDRSPDLVVNAAAYTAVDMAETDEAQAFAVNETGPGHLASVCETRNIPLIHISTDYVYDGEKTGEYNEHDPVAPGGVYGRSKLAGELLVAKNCRQHIILRTAWVHSPYGQNFVKTMLRLAATRDEINVVHDQVGTPTYAPHLARAVLDIARYIDDRDRGDVPWGLYHGAGAGQASWFDLACEVFEQSAKLGGPSAIVHPITTDQYPTPAVRPANSRLNCDKLNSSFGVALPDWKTGVRECVSELLGDGDAAP